MISLTLGIPGTAFSLSRARAPPLFLSHTHTGQFFNCAVTARCTGATALHEAAYHCDEVMVQILLDANANMLARDSGGRIPLHWATNNASTGKLSHKQCSLLPEVCRFSSKRVRLRPDTLVCLFPCLFSADALSALLQHPRTAAIINTPSTDSMTPVMYAAFNNRSVMHRLHASSRSSRSMLFRHVEPWPRFAPNTVDR